MIPIRHTVSVLLLLLAGCTTTFEKKPDASVVTPRDRDADFNQWLDSEFEAYLDFYPQSKTRLGIKTDYDKLNDVSVEFMQRVLDWRRASAAEMQTRFQRDDLSEQGKISWDLWIFMLKRAEAARPFRYHPTIFGWRGPHTGLPNSLINYHKVSSREDLEAYLKRLQQVDHQLGQYLERAAVAVDMGIYTSVSNYELALQNSLKILDGAPFTAGKPTGWWQDINKKIDALVTTGQIDDFEARGYRKQFRAAMQADVKPAYEQLVTWLKRTKSAAEKTSGGAWNLPDGEAYYRYRLEAITTLPLTAEEVHETGLQEVARIHAEMDAIRETVGYAGTLQEFFVFMRQDEQFYLASTDAGRASYLKLARDYLTAMQTELPRYFDLLPKASLEVRRVESFREQPGGAAHYARGTSDGTRPGAFYMHLVDMSAHPTYRIENLSYHEGLPGHHMQISIQQELDGIPKFRGYHGYTAYSEGWGLYSEYLAKDMGFYKSAYSDFGRLSGELWRAIRLVVDTGMHAKRWSEEKAISYALANSAKPASAVGSEIRRYIYMPAQATAYKIGMMKILELRARAKAALGDDFDYGEFHSIILGGGPLPLLVLERRVDAWLATR